MQSKILIIEDDHAITHLLDVALTLRLLQCNYSRQCHTSTL